tara:strand:- start:487 stop:798 length:312 start_codon:yes stop_codon:yes gene_type:complete
MYHTGCPAVLFFAGIVYSMLSAINGGYLFMEVMYPKFIHPLTQREEIILNKLYGQLVGVQNLAEELGLPEGAIIKIAQQVWLKLDVTTQQEFLQHWRPALNDQ